MKYLLLTVLILISNISWSDENTDQWGSWGSPQDQFSRQLESGLGKSNESSEYGSGIAGTDENLLHELDRSSLLDYQQKELDIATSGDSTSSEIVASGESGDSLVIDGIGSDTNIDISFSNGEINTSLPIDSITLNLSSEELQQGVTGDIDWAQAIEDGGITINGIEFTLQELKDGLIMFEVNEPSAPSFAPDTIESDNVRIR